MSTIPGEILALIARFNEHRETYQQQTYNETQVRREFIDPFFAALGWDVDNRDEVHYSNMCFGMCNVRNPGSRENI